MGESSNQHLTYQPRWLHAIPTGLFSTLVVIAILWLTLAPKPLPDNTLPIIPGIDKIGHACMFGGLTFAMMFDLGLRRIKRRSLPTYKWPTRWKTAVAVILFGLVTELLQLMVGTGRTGDLADWAADILGCWAALLLSPWLLHRLIWHKSARKVPDSKPMENSRKNS